MSRSWRNSNFAKPSPAMAALRWPPPPCLPPPANFARKACCEPIGEWRDASSVIGSALRRRSWRKFIILKRPNEKAARRPLESKLRYPVIPEAFPTQPETRTRRLSFQEGLHLVQTTTGNRCQWRSCAKINLAKSPWPMRGQNARHTGRVMKK